MNRAEVGTFSRRFPDLIWRYERALSEVERDEARRQSVPIDDLRGRGRSIALEAHGRTYLIDPILRELGWDIAIPSVVIIEDSADAPDSHRRRLDYHGRDNDNGRSLLGVEAKRPSEELPTPASGSIEQAIANTLRSLAPDKVNADGLKGAWRDHLKSISDYAKRLLATFGAAPVRFAITNGEWWVVFRDVGNTLLSASPVVGEIILFRDFEDIARRANDFCQLLGYCNLSGYIPPQHPAALVDYVSADEEALCSRYVEVDYTRYGERQPLISISVGVWVRTRSGAWLQFKKNYPKQFLVLSDDNVRLGQSRRDVEGRAQELIDELKRHRRLRFASVEEFDFPVTSNHEMSGTSQTQSLVRRTGRDRYHVSTMQHSLYFTEDETYQDCRYHNWSRCHEEGNAEGEAPVTAQSSEPRSFFPSGSPYHCAHAAIQIRRNQACVLLPFEERLCCRRCVFLARCWPDLSVAPCRLD